VSAVLKACQQLKVGIFNKKGNLRARTDEMWALAASHVTSSPGTLHADFKINRYNIVDKFCAAHMDDANL